MTRVRLGSAIALLVTVAACADPPTGPTPILPPPTVTAPVIAAVTVLVTRVEVDESVAVSADVTDAETSPANLQFVWTANAGTFEGQGANVTWKAVKGSAVTPADVVITLTVVEPYQALENNVLVNREHRISKSAQAFRLHDSIAEISKMTVTFLVDYFGNSSVSPEQCLVDFSGNCEGTQDEYEDIVEHRKNFVTYGGAATIQAVAVNAERTFASVQAACQWEDAKKATPTEHRLVKGTCRLTAVYELNRWWLCSSGFSLDSTTPLNMADFLRWHESRGTASKWPSIARSLRSN